jgi:predicted nucleotidyltransferase
VDLHGIPPSRVTGHYEPRLRAAEILAAPNPDPLEGTAQTVLETFSRNGVRSSFLGVTGSLLARAHSPRSDIDLVVYDRDAFHRVRAAVRRAIDSGTLQALGGSLWPQVYARRASSLTFGEYVWHERRKHNKFVIGQTKVDLSMVLPSVRETRKWRKQGTAEIRAGVIDDRWGFDYPARFVIDHPDAGEVVTYTNTYTGQARAGETIHARGWIEHSGPGETRLLVGTSREALGEFIKVIPSP